MCVSVFESIALWQYKPVAHKSIRTICRLLKRHNDTLCVAWKHGPQNEEEKNELSQKSTCSSCQRRKRWNISARISHTAHLWITVNNILTIHKAKTKPNHTNLSQWHKPCHFIICSTLFLDSFLKPYLDGVLNKLHDDYWHWIHKRWFFSSWPQCCKVDLLRVRVLIWHVYMCTTFTISVLERASERAYERERTSFRVEYAECEFDKAVLLTKELNALLLPINNIFHWNLNCTGGCFFLFFSF